MSGRTRKEAAKNRVGRNDRLGSGLGETKKKGEGRSKEERGGGQRPSGPE